MPKKRTKKPVEPRIDGLSRTDLKKLHSACRMVWHWSHPKRLALKRATGKGDFLYCENPECKKRSPKLFVDHIEPVGDIEAPGYFQRLFIPSAGLQCLCKKCHGEKTKQERADRALGLID